MDKSIFKVFGKALLTGSIIVSSTIVLLYFVGRILMNEDVIGGETINHNNYASHEKNDK